MIFKFLVQMVTVAFAGVVVFFVGSVIVRVLMDAVRLVLRNVFGFDVPSRQEKQPEPKVVNVSERKENSPL